MKPSQQKIAILGCGRSGIAAAKLALAQGAAEVRIFDSSPKAKCGDESLTCTAAATEQDAHAYAADLVILSPGIEGDSAWVQAFCAPKSAPLIGETEFAYRYYQGKIIAITGTNGKTTTTALIEYILKQTGHHATACGNYGLPLSSVVLSSEPCDYAVLEASSFQMESIVTFKPDIAIWLNFAPDHMDRYRKVEDYYEAKKQIFRNMGPQDLTIVRQGENLGQLPSPTQTFNAFEQGGNLTYQDGHIMQAGQAILDLRHSKLAQAHNAENCMAAYLCCHALGLSTDAIQNAIQQFDPPTHRCEMVAEFDHVLWLNYSKSTNLHSTIAALRSQTRPCILLLGGKNKGLDYSELVEHLPNKVKLCICFGEISEQLYHCLSPHCRSLRAEEVQECVHIAKAEALAGDVVLFSPGTSSFDQFSGYVQRGECFRAAVLATIKP